MNQRKKLASLFIVIAGLITASAFAATKGSLVVHTAVTVGGTRLPEGEYSLQWDGDGPEVTLTIKKDNRIKATVPAKLVPVNEAFSQDAIVVRTDGDGTRKLIEFRPSGKKFRLEIEAEPAESANRSQPSR